jgi:hypothetical protein
MNAALLQRKRESKEGTRESQSLRLGIGMVLLFRWGVPNESFGVVWSAARVDISRSRLRMVWEKESKILIFSNKVEMLGYSMPR